MPKLTQRTIDQVMEVNILDICEELGLVVIQGKWCRCPFHEDYHPSMRIYQITNTFKCFSAKCGEQGSAIDLVMRHRGLAYIDAIKWIAVKWGIPIEEEKPTPNRSSANSTSSKRLTMNRSSPNPVSPNRSSPNRELADPVAPCCLDRTLIARRQSTDSDFCRAVVAAGILTPDQMQRAASRYNLGMTRAGHVIFWYQDQQGNLREGKVMTYLPDCHRDKRHKPVTISWLMKNAGLLPKTDRYTYCLFGEHLLTADNKRTKPPSFARVELAEQQNNKITAQLVAIVESEKTAIIMSELVPDVTWLATGGMQGLSEANLLTLKPLAATHRIVLFPDTDTDGETYRHWCDIAAKTAQRGLQVAVSDVLETRTTPEQKARKIDIADLITD